ncbi:hypothetical protein P154DRAFT_574850 [Amniculicola lignicola CBS 123094]|uniref:Uncharacterized protein n=1 Tax=Amniculicola lignicola CBS 123094 TaxID=1392246 RepID=A0A6A5WI28_9PLEO|nr:hypothetical protein P154DRAFT_574850 [Amniculicola lignicola CBS 123094]
MPFVAVGSTPALVRGMDVMGPKLNVRLCPSRTGLAKSSSPSTPLNAGLRVPGLRALQNNGPQTLAVGLPSRAARVRRQPNRQHHAGSAVSLLASDSSPQCCAPACWAGPACGWVACLLEGLQHCMFWSDRLPMAAGAGTSRRQEAASARPAAPDHDCALEKGSIEGSILSKAGAQLED